MLHLSSLIFPNQFYKRKEVQEELQKAKLIISLFSSSLSVLTERVIGVVVYIVSIGVPYQVPPMRFLVLGHQYGNPNH